MLITKYIIFCNRVLFLKGASKEIMILPWNHQHCAPLLHITDDRKKMTKATTTIRLTSNPRSNPGTHWIFCSCFLSWERASSCPASWPPSVSTHGLRALWFLFLTSMHSFYKFVKHCGNKCIQGCKNEISALTEDLKCPCSYGNHWFFPQVNKIKGFLFNAVSESLSVLLFKPLSLSLSPSFSLCVF